MECPHCNQELILRGDFSEECIGLDGCSIVDGNIIFEISCESCLTTIGEQELQIALDVSSFTDEHEEHEVSVDIVNETFLTTVTPKGTFIGASATVRLNCSCGEATNFEWSDEERQNELIDRLMLD
jgi:hypothetical protein